MCLRLGLKQVGLIGGGRTIENSGPAQLSIDGQAAAAIKVFSQDPKVIYLMTESFSDDAPS